MKHIPIIGFFLIITIGCYFNASITNEESEKEKGEEITEQLYSYIIDKKYDNSIKSLLSKELLLNVPINRFDSTLFILNEKLGNYRERELIEWSTKRQKGNNEFWKCLLQYKVKYDKGESIELIHLIKENDSIKILSYNLEGEE